MTRLLLTTALSLATLPALAGGLAQPVPTPPLTPPPVAAPIAPPIAMPAGAWSGLYAGVQTGTLTFGYDPATSTEGEASGSVYGGHIGAMHQWRRVVLGGEVDYDMTDLTVPLDDRPVVVIDPTVQSLLRTKLRLGFDAGRVMPYVTGGFVTANLNNTVVDQTATGTFLGLGASYAVSPRIMLSGEYLTHEFDEVSDDAGVIPNVTGTADTLTVRASWRF